MSALFDDDSGSGGSASEEEEATPRNQARIDTAWSRFAESPNARELALIGIRQLDTSCVSQLLQKCKRFQQQQQQQAKPAPSASNNNCRLNQISLHQPSFLNEAAATAFVRDFLIGGIGSSLYSISLLLEDNDYDAPMVDAEHQLAFLRTLSQLPNHLTLFHADHMVLQGTETGQVLTSLLSAPTCQLETLHLTFAKFDNETFQGLLAGLKGHRRGLGKLCLGFVASWQLEDERFSALVQALVESKSKETLELLKIGPQHGLTTAAVPVFTSILRDLSITCLDVRYCRRTFQDAEPEHVVEFTRALAQNTRLKRLQLAACDMPNTVAGPLFEALTENGTLEFLDILGSRDNTDTLVQSLPRFKRLAELRANVEECSELADALRQNTSLVMLENLMGIGDDMSRFLQRNKLLTKRLARYLGSDHRDKLNTTTWPLCAVQLMEDCADASPVFAFVSATSLDIGGWNEKEQGRKRKSHR